MPGYCLDFAAGARILKRPMFVDYVSRLDVLVFTQKAGKALYSCTRCLYFRQTKKVSS